LQKPRGSGAEAIRQVFENEAIGQTLCGFSVDLGRRRLFIGALDDIRPIHRFNGLHVHRLSRDLSLVFLRLDDNLTDQNFNRKQNFRNR
jgi:hypothetical protein